VDALRVVVGERPHDVALALKVVRFKVAQEAEVLNRLTRLRGSGQPAPPRTSGPTPAAVEAAPTPVALEGGPTPVAVESAPAPDTEAEAAADPRDPPS
jgi:hypothetical protein